MSDRPSLEKQAETHLKQALDAESPETKDYHIRSALQFEEAQKDSNHVDHAETDGY